ncbi:MAG: phytoene/squalene synthase family protein [bacterium]
MAPHEYCQQTLQKVSRTFAINITFLHGDLYKAILCAYLFCRIADTIEDTVFQNSNVQKKLLRDYRDIFSNQTFSANHIQKWIEVFETANLANNRKNEDHKLVQNTSLVVENFLSLPFPYRQAICDCLIEMSEGMLATIRLKERQNGKVYFANTIAELNRYCYYVAGTVGILLTKLFATHSKSITSSILQALNRKAVSFGLGLQMTNIVKDCWTDYKRGWCYIPEELARPNGLSMAQFFEPDYRSQAQNTINDLIKRAVQHLDDGLAYTLHIPRRNYRIRLSCSLPLFFAINTLVEAKNNLRIFTGEKVKISREQVKKIIRDVQLLCFSNTALTNYYQSFRLQLHDVVE